MKILLLMFIMTVASTWQVKAQKCFSYEPSRVKLEGTIKRRSFAGPPNYESVARGDRLEITWVLRLARPICVSSNEESPEEKNIRDVQLVFQAPEQEYPRYRSFVGRKVVVTASLFQAHTGHHHTNVLATVRNIELAKDREK